MFEELFKDLIKETEELKEENSVLEMLNLRETDLKFFKKVIIKSNEKITKLLNDNRKLKEENKQLQEELKNIDEMLEQFKKDVKEDIKKERRNKRKKMRSKK